MPRPVPVPVRQAMFRLWQQGSDASEIAASLGIPLSTVYRLLERFRRDGAAGIPARYVRRAEDAPPPEAVKPAIDLRREHPTWGSEYVRMELAESAPERPVPSARALRRWFARAGLTPPRPGRRPRAEAERAAAPHDTWQMDAKEHIKLKKRKEVSWLRMIDECSGAVLHTKVFPPRDLGEGLARRRPDGAPVGLREMGPARRHAGR